MSTLDIISDRVERAMRDAGLDLTVTNTWASLDDRPKTAVLVAMTPNEAEQFITWLGQR